MYTCIDLSFQATVNKEPKQQLNIDKQLDQLAKIDKQHKQ